MERHPIEGLMGTTMENIKDMVDVNTVIGDPVRTEDGSTIIPVSRVSFGFVAGGGEYGGDGGKSGASRQSQPNQQNQHWQQGAQAALPGERAEETLPFAGGSGAGVSVQPMGFLVVGNGQVKLLSTQSLTPVDRVMELLPQVVGDLRQILGDGEGDAKAKDKRASKSVGSTQPASTPRSGGYDPLASLPEV
jgi:sporulation protein YtfJ